jgi:hypothetical protein
MPSVGARCLKGCAGSPLRSSPFCRLTATSCAFPLSSLHGVRNHLSEGMQLTAIHNTEMAGELTTLRAVVSSAVETFRVEVMGELVTEFQKL